MFRTFGIVATVLLCSVGNATATNAKYDEIDGFLDQITGPLVEYLKKEKQDAVVPRFLGLTSFPSGASAGFTEKLRAKLASHQIKLSDRAECAFVVQFKIPEAEFKQKRLQLRLEGRIEDQLGNEKEKFRVDGPVTDPKTIAEWLGLTLTHGPSKTPEEGQGRLHDAFKSDLVYVSDDGVTLLDSKAAKYGLEVLVNGKSLKIEDAEAKKRAVPKIHVDFKDEYVVRLYNWTNSEVSVDLKIDGLNTFHFSDTAMRFTDGEKKGKPLYHYYVIPPKQANGAPGVCDVKGWYKNPSDVTQFRITPPEIGAAAKAGIGQDALGMITATFHASWDKKHEANNKPRDEPGVTVTEIVSKQVKVPVQRQGLRTVVVIENGRRVEKQVPYTYTEYVMQMSTETKVSTGFGREIVSPSKGVQRVIGAERATLTLRYAKAEPPAKKDEAPAKK